MRNDRRPSACGVRRRAALVVEGEPHFPAKKHAAGVPGRTRPQTGKAIPVTKKLPSDRGPSKGGVVVRLPVSRTEIQHGRRADESDEAYAMRERHRVALEFARELVAMLDGGPITSDDDWIDPDPDPDLGPRDRAWADHDGWRRWQALKAAEAARKHWFALGRQDDMPRRISAVRGALELARAWKGPPVEAAFIRSFAGRDAPELSSVPIEDWTNAIARWPTERQGRGGDPRTRPIPWYVVVYDLLKPYGLTNAKDAEAMKRAYEVAPKKSQRRRAKE